MSQVFDNLVKNALDALNGAGSVVIRGRESGEYLEVLVEDTGPGIAAESIGRIFEPFFYHQGKQRHGARARHMQDRRRSPSGDDRMPERAGHGDHLRSPSSPSGSPGPPNAFIDSRGLFHYHNMLDILGNQAGQGHHFAASVRGETARNVIITHKVMPACRVIHGTKGQQGTNEDKVRHNAQNFFSGTFPPSSFF